jgi:hypothetical protein
VLLQRRQLAISLSDLEKKGNQRGKGVFFLVIHLKPPRFSS